jgi:enamine deaminase RidA (YjgF/YER057c/UK114 family)
MADQPTGSVQHLNPDTLHKNPAFTQAIVVSGPVKTIYIGGQNAVDADGNIVGEGDLAAQVEQTFKNLQAALAAADAGLEHIIKWTIYVVQGQDVRTGLGVFQKVWGVRPNPPTISVLFVAGLANPSFLCEIDAVAVVPQ